MYAIIYLYLWSEIHLIKNFCTQSKKIGLLLCCEGVVFMKEKNYDLELSLILARVYKSLKIKSGHILDILHKEFTQDDLSFFPRITLLAAQGPKGLTKKVRTLAVIIQLMYLSTEIHGQVPENRKNNNFLRDFQLPILTGDFLYSKVSQIICMEDCFEFMDELVDYFTELNESWIKYLEQKISLEELCEIWYGGLAARCMGMAANSSGFNNYKLKVFRELGFGLGILFGAQKFKLSYEEIEKSWQIVTNALKQLPPNEAKEILVKEAIGYYVKVADAKYLEKKYLENLVPQFALFNEIMLSHVN